MSEGGVLVATDSAAGPSAEAAIMAGRGMAEPTEGAADASGIAGSSAPSRATGIGAAAMAGSKADAAVACPTGARVVGAAVTGSLLFGVCATAACG
ncbi:MAG TPA: hypothetical protein DHB48_06320 [Sphingobium sp.]|nr:hypothetical protein [Sphingobium sp.]|tara:strand:+ start:204 stop:491 length:288 start_codon:yes stop_codon:yes gene_type:complete